jgi:hypothetical protein
LEGFIEGESERGVVLIKRRSGVPQLPKDRTAIDVVQEGVVIISQIRVAPVASEVLTKMILMGHPVSSCHVPVVRSCFIFFRTILSS